MIQLHERNPDHQTDQQTLYHKQDQLGQRFHIGRSVHTRQCLSHGLDGIREGEEDIDLLVGVRQQFDRERTDDIRSYLTEYQSNKNSSKVTTHK